MSLDGRSQSKTWTSEQNDRKIAATAQQQSLFRLKPQQKKKRFCNPTSGQRHHDQHNRNTGGDGNTNSNKNNNDHNNNDSICRWQRKQKTTTNQTETTAKHCCTSWKLEPVVSRNRHEVEEESGGLLLGLFVQTLVATAAADSMPGRNLQ